MNRLDVEMLNNAITGMGQSFRQANEDSATQEYRQQQLQRQIEAQKSAQQHYSAEEQHYKNEEDKQDAILKNAQAQQAVKMMNEQYDRLQSSAASDDEFNQAAQTFVQNHKEATDTILKASAFAPWADNPKYRAKVVQKGQFNTAPIANDAKAAQLNAQADEIDQQAAQQQGSVSLDAYGQMKRQAAALRTRAQAVISAGQRNGPQDYTEQVQQDALGHELSRQRTYGKQPTPAPTAAGTAGGTPTVSTQADFDKLPSGTVYIGKDGKKYQKP